MRICGAAFLIAFALLVAACTDPSAKFVGRWQWNDGEVVEYMKDGTAAWAKAGMNAAGTWKLEGDKFTVVASGRQVMFRLIEVTDETIRLERIPDGTAYTASRLK